MDASARVWSRLTDIAHAPVRSSSVEDGIVVKEAEEGLERFEELAAV